MALVSTSVDLTRTIFYSHGEPEAGPELLAREIINETKIITHHTKGVFDSTVLVDAVITEDTFVQIKRVRKFIPVLGQVPLFGEIDYARAKPAIDFSDKDLVNETLSVLVSDANAFVDRTRELGCAGDDENQATKCSLDAQQIGAFGLFEMVAGQDVELVDEETGTYRLIRGVAKDRVISTVDPGLCHEYCAISTS